MLACIHAHIHTHEPSYFAVCNIFLCVYTRTSTSTHAHSHTHTPTPTIYFADKQTNILDHNKSSTFSSTSRMLSHARCKDFMCMMQPVYFHDSMTSSAWWRNHGPFITSAAWYFFSILWTNSNFSRLFFLLSQALTQHTPQRTKQDHVYSGIICK